MGQTIGTTFTGTVKTVATLPLDGPMFDGPGAKDLGNLTLPWIQLFQQGLTTNALVSTAKLTVVVGTAKFAGGTAAIASGLTTVTGVFAFGIAPATGTITGSIPLSNTAKLKSTSLPAVGTVNFQTTGGSTDSFWYLIIGVL